MNITKRLVLLKILLCIALVSTIFISFYAWKENNIRNLTVSIVLCFSLIFASFSKDKHWKDSSIQNIFSSRGVYLLNISFFALFTLSIFLLHTHLYCRPLEYFIIISVISTIVFAEYLFTNYRYWPLLHTILLTLNLWLGLWYTFPSVLGGDSPFHFGLVKTGLDLGNLLSVNPRDFIYVDAPIFHIACIEHMLIMDIAYKNALTTSLIVPLSIIVPLSLHIIGKRISIRKLDLSSLIITPFPFFLWYICQISPFSYGVMLFIILIPLLLRWEHACIPLGIVVIFAIGFTHPLIMSMVMILVSSFFVASLIIKVFFSESIIRPPLTLTICVFFTIWMYHCHINWAAEAGKRGFELLDGLLNMFSPREFLPSVAGHVQSLPDICNEILFSLNIALMIGLWVIGIVVLIKKNILFHINSEKEKIFNWFMFGSVPFILFIYSINFIGISSVISYRWLGIAIFLSLPPIVLAFTSSYFPKKDRIIKCCLFFGLIFLMVTNPISNMDNPIYAKKDSIRWGYTTSEITGIEFIYSHIHSSNIIHDNSFNAYYRSLPFKISNPKKESDKKVLVLRDYIFERSFYVPREKVGSDIGFMTKGDKNIIKRDLEKMDVIYNNSDVKIIQLGNIHPYWVKRYF